MVCINFCFQTKYRLLDTVQVHACSRSRTTTANECCDSAFTSKATNTPTPTPTCVTNAKCDTATTTWHGYNICMDEAANVRSKHSGEIITPPCCPQTTSWNWASKEEREKIYKKEGNWAWPWWWCDRGPSCWTTNNTVTNLQLFDCNWKLCSINCSINCSNWCNWSVCWFDDNTQIMLIAISWFTQIVAQFNWCNWLNWHNHIYWNWSFFFKGSWCRKGQDVWLSNCKWAWLLSYNDRQQQWDPPDCWCCRNWWVHVLEIAKMVRKQKKKDAELHVQKKFLEVTWCESNKTHVSILLQIISPWSRFVIADTPAEVLCITQKWPWVSYSCHK